MHIYTVQRPISLWPTNCLFKINGLKKLKNCQAEDKTDVKVKFHWKERFTKDRETKKETIYIQNLSSWVRW